VVYSQLSETKESYRGLTRASGLLSFSFDNPPVPKSGTGTGVSGFSITRQNCRRHAFNDENKRNDMLTIGSNNEFLFEYHWFFWSAWIAILATEAQQLDVSETKRVNGRRGCTN
jgi:hypothetical protein